MKFIFKGYEARLEKGEVLFYFGFTGKKNIDFTEKISFPPVVIRPPESLLKSILDNLMLILGISYWKAYCPKEIVIESNFLTKEQAEFWDTVYVKGLGEFFYKNKIDFKELVKFPFNENAVSAPTDFPRKNRSLLGLGGGKDSIVVAEILKLQNKDFDLITGVSEIQQEVALAIGKKPLIVKRELDSKLFDINKESGVYDGHVPVSVYYAFILLLSAALFDYKYVLVGNEKSANYGNVEYLGEMINHQWSKSEEFEKLFNDYVGKFITPDIKYSSPLREMTELQVVEKFAQYPQYFKVFSSCNRNFKINNPSQKKWCGECPKCLFVFISLAAFLPKEEILDIFGKNLFEDKNLIPLFEELVGVRNFKPFECVGTQDEVKEALKKILERREFNETILMKHFKSL
jgi:hypothetical protein